MIGESGGVDRSEDWKNCLLSKLTAAGDADTLGTVTSICYFCQKTYIVAPARVGRRKLGMTIEDEYFDQWWAQWVKHVHKAGANNSQVIDRKPEDNARDAPDSKASPKAPCTDQAPSGSYKNHTRN